MLAIRSLPTPPDHVPSRSRLDSTFRSWPHLLADMNSTGEIKKSQNVVIQTPGMPVDRYPDAPTDATVSRIGVAYRSRIHFENFSTLRYFCSDRLKYLLNQCETRLSGGQTGQTFHSRGHCFVLRRRILTIQNSQNLHCEQSHVVRVLMVYNMRLLNQDCLRHLCVLQFSSSTQWSA